MSVCACVVGVCVGELGGDLCNCCECGIVIEWHFVSCGVSVGVDEVFVSGWIVYLVVYSGSAL